MARMHGSLRALAATILLGAAACMGGVSRVYDDGGAADATAGDTGVQGADGSSSGGDDATQTAEAAVDATGDGAVDGGAPDGAAGDTGVAHDAAPEAEAGPTFLCNGQPVTSCATCAGNPIDCVFCAADGGHPGVCSQKQQLCINSTPQDSAICTCQGTSPAGCPAPFHVCTPYGGTSYCQTCGEQGSDKKPCKGGGTCDEAAGACK